MTVHVDGLGLTIEDVVRVARHGDEARLTAEARERMERARRVVEEVLEAGQVVYGVNTGFGKFSDVAIPEDQLDRLSRNLIVSCCTGVGEAFPVEVVRAMLLLRANSLAVGNSGVRPLLVDGLLELLNRRIHPVVPSQGSVGSSGDLAPLSHMAVVLMGGGRAEYEGEVLPGAVALERAGMTPVMLKAKEGLSLSNGTQAMTALGALAVYDAERLADTADVAGAFSAEALEAVPFAFDERIQRSRPHAGQVRVAQNLRRLLADSDLVGGATHGRVQDAYALRCIPQVHGASRDAIAYCRGVIEIEINSATDNPLVFPDDGEILSGGNFHGQPVALAMDVLTMALAELGDISERRTERLVNPALSGGLPAFLIAEGGINDGFMVPQYTAAALVSENKVLSHPACVDSIPTSANQEDHVSMGTIGARQAREVLINVQRVLAIELMSAAQAVDFRSRRPGSAGQAVHRAIRSRVAHLEEDREMADDIEAVAAMVREGRFLEVLLDEAGPAA